MDFITYIENSKNCVSNHGSNHEPKASNHGSNHASKAQLHEIILMTNNYTLHPSSYDSSCDLRFNRRIRWLMFLRVTIVTGLLGAAAAIQIKGTQALPAMSLKPVYSIILATYILSLLYLLLLKIIKSLRWNIYIQGLFDVAIITVLLHVTGGIESSYSPLYILVIIYSSLFLGRRGSVIFATAASILYCALIGFEHYGLIQPVYLEAGNYDHSAGFVLSRIFIHIVSFYVLAFLAGVAVRQEEITKELLAKKVNAFDQLDLLHRSIIESVHSGILTVDLHGRIKSFNRAAEEITGLSRSEVMNKDIDVLFPGFWEVVNSVKDEDAVEGGRHRFERTVSDRIVGFSVSTLKDSGGGKIGNIVIFQDLTDTKEMERQAEKNKRLALIGEMAAGLAHEMRSPLASISGSIQMLSRELKLNETDSRLMQIVLRGKEQLEGFIRDFLLLARPGPAAHRENVNINALMDDVIESVRYMPDWHEDIEITGKSYNGATVYGCREEIREVIRNLILNAVQSMPGGGELKTEIRPVGTKHIEIRICDTGCGIDKGDLTKVLEPFFTTKDKGTGLGLAIVNRIVESHGGNFRIESETGKGTTCSVLLPVANSNGL